IAGAGLLITVMATPARAQRRGRGGEDFLGSGAGTLEARLHLAADGTVTVLSGKVEVGQGSRAELAMAAAEEMRLPLDRLRMVMADTELTPNDGMTAGSRTTPATVPAVRRAGAVAGERLLEAASSKWKTDRGQLEVRDGAAIDPAGNRKFGYADLARSPELAEANKLTPPPDTKLIPVKDWRVLGTPHYQ